MQQITGDDPVRRRQQPRTRQPSSSCPPAWCMPGCSERVTPPGSPRPSGAPGWSAPVRPTSLATSPGAVQRSCSGALQRPCTPPAPPIAPAPGGHRNRPWPGQHLENFDGQPFVRVAVTPNGDAAATEILHQFRPGRRREPGEWGRHDAHIQRGRRPTCPGVPPLRDPPGAGRIDSHADCPGGPDPAASRAAEIQATRNPAGPPRPGPSIR